MRERLTRRMGRRIASGMLLLCMMAAAIVSTAAQAAENYDVNPPVIEKVTFAQKGQTVKRGDVLEVEVVCYDAESEIKSVEANFSNGVSDISLEWSGYVNEENSASASVYTGQTTVWDTCEWDTIYLYSVSVTDVRNNYATKSLSDCSCTVSNPVASETPETPVPGGDVSKTYHYTSVTADKETAKVGDKVRLSVQMEDGYQDVGDGTFAVLQLEGEEPAKEKGRICAQEQRQITLEYDAASNAYTGELVVDGNMSAGIWETVFYLDCYVRTEDGISQISDVFSDNYSYREVFSVDNPDFEPITLEQKVSKSGDDAFLRTGDSVTYLVKAPGRERVDYAYMYIDPVSTTGVASEDGGTSGATLGSRFGELTYDETQDAYVYTMEITKDTYPCEWRVDRINLYCNTYLDDIINQQSVGWQAYIGSDAASDAYVWVNQGGTFVGVSGKVSMRVQYMDGNGNPQYQTVVSDSIASRTMTYRELLDNNVGLNEIDFNDTQEGMKFQGLQAFQGWYYGNALDLDAPIVFNGWSNETKYVYITAVYDTMVVNAWVHSLQNADGNLVYGYDYQSHLVPRDMTMGDFIEQYVGKPQEVEGLTFMGWEIDGDVRLTDKLSDLYPTSYSAILFSVRARYDKNIVEVGMSYHPEGSYWRTYSRAYVFAEEGMTYGEALEQVVDNAKLEHNKELVFCGWSKPVQINEYDPYGTYDYDEDKEITAVYSYLPGVYADYVNACARLYARDADNAWYSRESYMVAKKGDTITLPRSIGDMKDITWNYYMIMSASTPNNIPVSGNTIVLEDDIYVSGTGTYTGPKYNESPSLPDKPVEPEKPNTPEVKPNTPEVKPNTPEVKPSTPEVKPSTPEVKPSTPEVKPEKPAAQETSKTPANTAVNRPAAAPAAEQATEDAPAAVVMKEEQIQETVTKIAQAQKGESVVVEMGDATVISKDVLREAQRTGVNVVLQMEGYSWTIDAKDIKASNLQDINHEVNLHSEAIPSAAISKLAGDHPVTQISLTHEGNFGFAATLAFNIGSQYKDQYGNLYWYDSTGKMVFIDSGLIDADGNVNLTFSHASDYAIVMKDTDDSLLFADADTGTAEAQTRGAAAVGTAADAGSKAWVVALVVVLAAALCGGLIYYRKRS